MNCPWESQIPQNAEPVRLSTSLQNMLNGMPFYLQRDMDTPVKAPSCIKHGIPAQTALEQLFRQVLYGSCANNQTFRMPAGGRAFRLLDAFWKREGYLSRFIGKSVTHVWIDELNDSYEFEYVYVPPEEQMLAYMGFPTGYSKRQIQMSQRWDEMVHALITAQ